AGEHQEPRPLQPRFVKSREAVRGGEGKVETAFLDKFDRIGRVVEAGATVRIRERVDRPADPAFQCDRIQPDLFALLITSSPGENRVTSGMGAELEDAAPDDLDVRWRRPSV